MNLGYERDDVQRTSEAFKVLPGVLSKILAHESDKKRRAERKEELKKIVIRRWIEAPDEIDVVGQFDDLEEISDQEKIVARAAWQETNIDLRFKPSADELLKRELYRTYSGRYGVKIEYPLMHEKDLEVTLTPTNKEGNPIQICLLLYGHKVETQ